MNRLMDVICKWLRGTHTDLVENRIRKQHPGWKEMVKAIDTREKYRLTVKSMFEDGKYHDGRWLVLAVFTQDVCKAHPLIANQVSADHVTFFRSHRL